MINCWHYILSFINFLSLKIIEKTLQTVENKLDCYNSVDGSIRFMCYMNWFRLVCSNGLIAGHSELNFSRKHSLGLDIDLFGEAVENGIAGAIDDKKKLENWQKKGIDSDVFARWVEEDLREAWGFNAAARVYHIAGTGRDVEIDGSYSEHTPTSMPVRFKNPVPGCKEKAESLFDLSQVLAWMAKERNDLGEQLEWKKQIPELLKRMLS